MFWVCPAYLWLMCVFKKKHELRTCDHQVEVNKWTTVPGRAQIESNLKSNQSTSTFSSSVTSAEFFLLRGHWLPSLRLIENKNFNKDKMLEKNFLTNWQKRANGSKAFLPPRQPGTYKLSLDKKSDLRLLPVSILCKGTYVKFCYLPRVDYTMLKLKLLKEIQAFLQPR